MKSLRITGPVVITLAWLAGCATARPAVLDNASRLLASKDADELGTRKPDLIKDAKAEVAKAETAQERGNVEEATLRASIAIAKFQTAKNFVARGEARAMGRAKAESDEATAAERARFAALEAKLKEASAAKPKDAAAGRELEAAKKAILAARDKQADAIKEGAPTRAEEKYGEGKRLVENAIESLSLGEYKEANSSADRALAALDAAVVVARGASISPHAPDDGKAPVDRAMMAIQRAEDARSDALARVDPNDRNLVRGDAELDSARRAQAAGDMARAESAANQARTLYLESKRAEPKPDPRPVVSAAAPGDAASLRGLVESKIVELQLKKTELLGQLRDESCKGPFREFDATLELAQKRFDVRDYARALEFVVRSGERLRACEVRVAASPTAEKTDSGKKTAVTALTKAQEELARAEGVNAQDPKVFQAKQLLSRAEAWFDRSSFAEAETLAKQAERLLVTVKAEKAEPKPAEAKVDARQRDQAQKAIDQMQERLARAEGATPNDPHVKTAGELLRTAERNFDRGLIEASLSFVAKAKSELDQVKVASSAAAPGARTTSPAKEGGPSELDPAPAPPAAEWKRAYDAIQRATRTRESAKGDASTREALAAAEAHFERARAAYKEKLYGESLREAEAADKGFAAVGDAPTALDPTTGGPRSGATAGVAAAPDAATGDWTPAYRQITEALKVRDRVLPHAKPEDQSTLSHGAASLAKARGAYQAKAYGVAQTYADAALADYRNVTAAAKKRGADIKEEEKVDARKAEEALRDAQIALDICEKERCDDRDTALFVRGKALLGSASQNVANKDLAYGVQLAEQAKKSLESALALPRKNAPPPPTDPKALEKLREEMETALREAGIYEELCKQRDCGRVEPENALRATQILKASRGAAEAKQNERARDMANQAQGLFKATLDRMPKFQVPDSVSRVSLKDGQLVMAPAIEFGTGNAKITAGSQPTVADLATLLKANREVVKVVRLVGHTDNRGNAAANKTLSQARAQSVVNALVNLGVPAGLLVFEGRGGEVPLADNGTEAGRKMNRRIEARLELK